MKKILSIFVVLMYMLIMTSCSGIGSNVQIVRTSWESSDVEGDFYIIESYDELTEYVTNECSQRLADSVASYDEEFFKEKVLVFALVSEGSGSISHKVKSIKINSGVLEVTVKRNVPEIGTMDMAEWTIVFELDIEEVNKIIDTNLIIK